MYWGKDVGFRVVEKADLEVLRKIRNDPTTWIYLTDTTPINEAMQERWFQKISLSSDTAYYSIFKVGAEFPAQYENGVIGIIRTDCFDPINRSIRVGVDIAISERGKGYGTKTYALLLDWLFRQRNMNRVHLAVLDINAVGLKLYRNAGFIEEGRQRQAIWRDGAFRDYVLMSILADEYRAGAR